MSMAMPPSDGRPFDGGEPAGPPASAPVPRARGIGPDPQPGQGLALPLNQFLSALGRELITPMNRMLSMARLLLQADLARDQQRIALEICHSGDSLLRLVNDALDYAAAGEVDRKPDAIPFDLRLLIDETIERLRPRSGEKRLTVESRVHHEVPSRLVGDAGRLRQVLWNVALHSIAAVPAGGLVLRVGRLQENHDSVALRFDWRWYHTVEMGGVAGGFESTRASEAAEARDWEPCESGLQLSIARRLAGLIGGEIAIEDEPGFPARAWFDLTFGKQAELPQAEISVGSHESLAGARVLVADPREAMRRSTAATLETWGCRTSESSGAEDARAQLSEASAAGDPFRFVLIEQELAYASDEQGGSLRGTDATGATPHFIVLAAVGRRGDLDRARKRGFSAYLPAPIDCRELADALIEIERLAAATPAGAERPVVTRHWMAEMRRSRTRILIVEDDVVSALVTDWTLRRIGYQVVRLRTAAELRALPPGAAAAFDLVILALRLPDAEGLTLASELRASARNDRPAAIVAIGYEGTRVEHERCHAAGVDAYLSSPVDLAHLCELVEQITRTDLKYGPEREDLIGRPIPTVRERAQALGMVLFRYHVDPGTEVESASLPVVAAPVGEPGKALDVERLNETSLGNATVRSHLLGLFTKQMRAGLVRLAQAAGSSDADRARSEIDFMKQVAERVGAVGCAEVLASMQRRDWASPLAQLAAPMADASREVDRFERAASLVDPAPPARAPLAA